MKLTKQGVRDLNPPKQKRKVVLEIPVQCDHKRMRECHPGCGNWICRDCGLTWDDDAEK